MEWCARWIAPKQDMGDVCPVFTKAFANGGDVAKAELFITAMGVYEARLNGARVGEDVLAPGWTSYEKRHQYQCYDVTDLLKQDNLLEVVVGKGWYRSPMPGWAEPQEKKKRTDRPAGMIAQLVLTGTDGSKRIVATDGSWTVGESQVRFSEIYDGETFDATFRDPTRRPVVCLDKGTDNLIPQQGEEIREEEFVAAERIFVTPAGETVVDFGQEVTGYVRFTVEAQAGDLVEISHGEVLDKAGNFYNENYREAKAKLRYVCKNGVQSYHPRLTFFGFRYIRLDRFPGTPTPEQFTAVAVHSHMKRTGYLSSSNPLLNRLFSNVIWGQRGNFLDIPTDCPQRDERLGWTGDAQAFVKTASYNYDVERFFTKWLSDLAADQCADGSVPNVIPACGLGSGSAAWDDAATICPWQIYMTYGNPEILRRQFASMKKYLDFITGTTRDAGLWTGGSHYEDWLGLDAPAGSYKGSSRADFIASAFYAHSTDLVVKAGKVLGEDVRRYEELYRSIVNTFRQTFPDYRTQTEMVLAVHFGLAPEPQKMADQLAARIVADGSRLQTGFVGTPYLLHVLSEYGHTDLAYTLLLRTEYPSWLYPVTKGATTVWEHWDGIMENGDFWSADMNSFNHYAYGSVMDWVYEEAAGIKPAQPGFAKIHIEPKPDDRLEWLEVSLETRRGTVRSCWRHIVENGHRKVRYEILTPSPAVLVIQGRQREVAAGEYIFCVDMGAAH